MKTIKLIFVDDDKDDRDLIQEGLNTLIIDHFLVLESSASLLTHLDNLELEELPEAIILDLNMPVLSGLEVLKILKNTVRYHHISVYIFSTSSSIHLRQQCMEKGAADYYVKPVTMVELYELLNEINTTVMD
jgi:CheY-like chemotaxis protein